jgi:DNA-3-methyladenine glycosylase I
MDVPAKTAQSDVLSKDLARRGFRFVGSTIIYAFMQATGLVNDHLVTCPRWTAVQHDSRAAE